MEYSVAGDAAIDAIIQSLVVDDCYPGMMTVDDGRREQWVCETSPQRLKGIVNALGHGGKWVIVWIVRTTIPLLSGLQIYTGE
jgi:hypothetical protein